MAAENQYEGNQYAGYLDDSSRPMGRFLKDQDDNGVLPFIGRQALHIGVSLGVAALAHRTGAVHEAARLLETHGKGTIQAFRETFHANGKLLGKDPIQFMKDWHERSNTNINLRKEALNDFMRARGSGIGHEYDTERFLRQINHTINVKVKDTMVNSMRFDRIIHELRNTHGMEDEHVNQIYRALEHGAVRYRDIGYLGHLEEDSFRGLLKSEGIHEGLMDAVVDSRRNANQFLDSQRAEINRVVQERQKQLRDFTEQNMDGLVKNRWDQKLRNAVGGHRLATVNDVMQMHENGMIQLDDDLRIRMRNIIEKNQKFGDSIFDRNLYVRENRDGAIREFRDYKVFDDIKRTGQNWLASTIPGGLGHLRDFLNVREAWENASVQVINRGARFQSLNAQMGVDINDTLHQEVMFFNGKFVHVNPDSFENPSAVEILNKQRDMYLTSSSFGTIANNLRHIGGIMSKEKERNAFTQAFDLFNQDKDSGLGLKLSVFTKFLNDDWERNIIKNALKDGVDVDSFHDVRRYFEKYSNGLSARTLNHMMEHEEMPSHVKDFVHNNGINFTKQEDMMRLFRYFGEEEGKDYASPQLKSMWKDYQRDPDAFLAKKKPIGEANLFIGEYTHVQTGYDKINQTLGLEMIHQIQDMYPRLHGGIQFNFRSYIDNLHTAGQIFKSDRQESQFLYSLYEFQRAGHSIYSNPTATVNHVNDLFTGTSEAARAFQQNLTRNVRRTNPMYEKYTGTRPPNLIGNDYIAVNKAWSGWNGLGTIKDYARQLSLTTGRRNMEDVTTASIFGSYYPFYRLQDALGDLKLGFSDDSLSSPLKIMSSLFLKRFLPIYGAYQAYQYADYRLDQDTGAGINERYQNNIAREDLKDAWKRDQAGITARKKRDFMLHPGIDQFGDQPEIRIPGLGRFGFGRLAGAFFSPGTPIDEKDTYNYDEMQDYYENGVDPLRKSKWWLLGSKTAYRGDRITEFRPNALRMADSNWEYSSVTQSGHDRWEQSWFPTFENWFGLKHVTGQVDPYAWERQHYYDRPYLLTGSMFNPNTMWFGDIGNATIGQLFKPVRQMHKEYWGDPELYTEENKELGKRPTRPITTRVSPAGRMENVVKAGADDYGAGTDTVQYVEADNAVSPEASSEMAWMQRVEGAKINYIRTPQLDGKGNKTGSYVITDMNNNETIFVPASMADQPTEQLFAAAQQPGPDDENTKPRAMFSQDYPYQQEIANRKLRNLKDPRSLEWRSQESFENFREVLGAYNWIVGDELVGYDPYKNKTRIQSADNATNLSNQFWSMNIGSLGGELSEIGRRFIRRDSGQLDDYNPIRNTMPDWMPGGDYFLNFQTGDPYSKIEHGEYRLPGEAYEKINQLHPDETGRYGAFDKFKILSDVAPWSDEYRFWRDYFVHNNTDPELRKQGAAIKRQVSQRKKKYEFTDYHFKYKDITKQDVTVTKFLDDYTFLTKEYGDTPIRLAGMNYRPSADGVMAQYFKPGDKVTIGLDADESKQQSDDTYKSVRAVVYKRQFNINQDILQRGLMKENETDFSSPAVQARFTKAEITEGSRWETLAHAESPLNTKFLQVRTALEEYERDQVYGKDWATWKNFLTSDYLIPTFQQAFRHNFLESVLEGGIAGGIVGGFFLGGGRNRTLGGAIIGGVIGGMGNMYRHLYESKNGGAWIPERRRKENDINEYFDILKYMKYTGLYEEAKRVAADQGYDVDAVEEQIDLKKQQHDETVKALEDERRYLFTHQPKGWDERRKEINAQLNEMTQDWDEINLPEPVLQALQYKEQSETTLYGIDPYEDRMKVARAFPYKDKWFFQEFVDAPERDRERILELVPENERRVYKALWGMGDDGQKPLEYYFDKYYLPGANWAGWQPDVNLDDMKVKAVMNDGIDLSDFNFWEDDVQASMMLPDISKNSNDIHRHNGFRGYRDMERNIRAVMEGQGLRDVNIQITPSSGSDTRVHFDYQEDRSDEIDSYMKENIGSLM